MRTCALLVFAIAVAVATATPPNPNRIRLIAFNDSGIVEELTQAEVDVLAADADVHFMDVTETKGNPPTGPGGQPIYPKQAMHKTLVDSLIPQIDTNNMLNTINSLSAFYTRWYTSSTGVNAAEWVYDTAGSLAGARLNDDVFVSFFNFSTGNQPCVIVQIQGSISDDVTILGGHIDSVGATTTSRSPGCDDDASGASTVMEVYRVIVQSGFVPNNTLEFHFYAAEEAGLLGSQAVANEYAAQGVTIVGMLQLDMTMYASYPAPIIMAPITDYTDDSLTAFERILIDTYCLLTWENSKCGYACSDHASWTAVGYSSAFIFESPFSYHNPHIHSADDTMAYLSLDHGLEFAKLGLAHSIELSYITDPYSSYTSSSSTIIAKGEGAEGDGDAAAAE